MSKSGDGGDRYHNNGSKKGNVWFDDVGNAFPGHSTGAVAAGGTGIDTNLTNCNLWNLQSFMGLVLESLGEDSEG